MSEKCARATIWYYSVNRNKLSVIELLGEPLFLFPSIMTWHAILFEFYCIWNGMTLTLKHKLLGPFRVRSEEITCSIMKRRMFGEEKQCEYLIAKVDCGPSWCLRMIPVYQTRYQNIRFPSLLSRRAFLVVFICIQIDGRQVSDWSRNRIHYSYRSKRIKMEVKQKEARKRDEKNTEKNLFPKWLRREAKSGYFGWDKLSSTLIATKTT